MVRTPRFILVGAFALPFILLYATPAAAQDAQTTPADAQEVNPYGLSLEELFSLKVESVFAASKHRQNTLQAPSSVTVITGAEIRRYGYRSLADTLAHVRGFFSTYDRNYAHIGTRGFNRPGDYNSRFLLLIDGHRFNENVFDLTLVGTDFPLDLELVDRIEVIRGPSSSLYGTSAFFAVVNIITINGKDLDGPFLSASQGTLNTNSQHVAWGQRFGRASDFLVSVSRYHSDGYKELYYPEFVSAGSDGIARNQDMDRNGSVYVKATLENFSIQGLYGSRTKQIPTGSFGTTFNDPRTHTRDWRGYVDGTYHRLMPKGWNLDVRGYYDRYGYDGIDAFDDTDQNGDPLSRLTKDLARGHWAGEETQLSRKFESGSVITAGTEFRKNLLQKQQNLDLEPAVAVFLDQADQSNVWAAFLQAEYAATKRLTVNLGVRYDHYSTFGGSTNPRVAVIFNPEPASAIKFLYGQAFRAPNVYELYWHEGEFNFGNSNLRPETIKSAELVYEKTLPRHWVFAANAFRRAIGNLIIQSPQTGAPGFVNFGEIHVAGWETEIERRTPEGFETRLSYAFQTSVTRETGQPLTDSPQHVVQAKIGDSWVGGRIWTGLDLYAMSSRISLNGSKMPGHLVPNITIGTGKPIRGLSLSATLYNATNAHYGDPGSSEHLQNVIPQDGRTLRFKVTYQRHAQ